MTVTRTEFPFEITTQTAWIEMGDGTRLHAQIRLPVTDEPVPAILEHLPYRKDDGTLVRDSLQHDYLSGFGFACVRVDIRGSGNSDGILTGEYLATELDDAVQVIDWISKQAWCSGSVWTHSELWCDAAAFHTSDEITAFENGEQCFTSTRSSTHERR